MKPMAKRLLPIFLFLAISPVLMAQSSNGTAVAELSVQSETFHPEYEGYTNILGGTTYNISYNFSINLNLGTSQKISGISQATYQFGAISGSLNTSFSDNGITVDPLQFNSLGEGEYELTYTIIYNFIETSTPETAQEQTATLVCTSNGKVKVWPSVSSSPGETTKKSVISGTQVTLGTINYSGGNSSGWKVQWSAGEPGVDGKTCTYTSTTTGTMRNNTVTATVTNTAPGNTGDWYTETYTYTIPTYVNPSVELINFPSAVFAGNQITGNARVEGGNTSGWEYSWTPGNGTSSNFSYTPQTATTLDISLTATNSAPDGVTLYNGQTNTNVIVYEKPSVLLTTPSRTNYINGENFTLTVVPTGGQSGKWTYEWMVDGSIQSETQASFNFICSNAGSSNRTYNISVVAKNIADGVSTPFTQTLNFTATVWPSPDLVAQSDPNPVTCDGRSLKMSVSTTGGYESGWVYEWKLNGNVIPGAVTNELEQTFSNTGISMQTDIYTVHVTNGVTSTDLRFDRTFTFTVSVYPAAKFGVSQGEYKLYYGEIANLEATYSGGYPEGWKFQWNTPNNSTDPNNHIIIPDSQEDNYNLTYNVVITNSYRDEEWYKGTFPVNIEAWSRGEIRALPLDSVDYNRNAFITLETRQKGGYIGPNGGWKYIWNDNGESIAGNANFNVNETNYSDEVETLTYFLDATNSLDGRLGTDETFNWTIRVWPEILAPERISLSATSLRGGETLYVGIYPEPARGGYTPNGIDTDWKYLWTANGAVVSDYSSFTATTSNGTRKSIETIEYELKLQNMGPNGVYWYNNTFKSSVKVYAAPQMPISLVRKGNGTTCTMIAESVLNNDQLLDLDYCFVFGYTDAAGQDHTAASVQTNRYDHFEPSVYNNPQNIFWVYTSWTYEDGSVITSGKRFLNGYDESFNGSVFSDGSGSRGDASGLGTISNDTEYFVSDGYSFSASLEEVAEANVNVYDATGYMVKHLKYPGNSEFNETLDLSSLVDGIYFVEVRIGVKKKTTKIFIKSVGKK